MIHILLIHYFKNLAELFVLIFNKSPIYMPSYHCFFIEFCLRLIQSSVYLTYLLIFALFIQFHLSKIAGKIKVFLSFQMAFNLSLVLLCFIFLHHLFHLLEQQYLKRMIVFFMFYSLNNLFLIRLFFKQNFKDFIIFIYLILVLKQDFLYYLMFVH